MLPNQPVWPSLLAIAVLTGINILGINRTAAVATVLSFSTTIFLVALVVLSVNPNPSHLGQALQGIPTNGFWSVLTGAGVVFFAFAGYARVATLGNEVKDPKRNIPRAIFVSMVSVATRA